MLQNKLSVQTLQDCLSFSSLENVKRKKNQKQKQHNFFLFREKRLTIIWPVILCQWAQANLACESLSLILFLGT